jgi:hypothetical protein
VLLERNGFDVLKDAVRAACRADHEWWWTDSRFRAEAKLSVIESS